MLFPSKICIFRWKVGVGTPPRGCGVKKMVIPSFSLGQTIRIQKESASNSRNSYHTSRSNAFLSSVRKIASFTISSFPPRRSFSVKTSAGTPPRGSNLKKVMVPSFFLRFFIRIAKVSAENSRNFPSYLYEIYDNNKKKTTTKRKKENKKKKIWPPGGCV